MQWLFFLVLPLLSSIKVVTQGHFSKGKVHTIADSIKFNGFMFLYSALALFALTVRLLPSIYTILFALAVGVLTILFQCFYISAFREGAVSLSTTIANFGCAIPVLFSIIFLNESVTLFKIFGFALIAAALLLMPAKAKKEKSVKGIKTTKKWFFLIIFATLCSGSINILQNVFAGTPTANEKEVFTALTYLFAAILSFIILPFFAKKSPAPLYKSDLKINLGLILIGASLGVYNLLVVTALTLIPATEFFPTASGLQILTAVIISSITFKEIPSLKQLIGIALTIAAVVLINLQ